MEHPRGMLQWNQRIFYNSIITAALLDKGGTPFEDWFVELGCRLWGPDFQPVRAQGGLGDLKCDGRRVSSGTFYQCYGPRRVDARSVGSKIRSDFIGAREIWGAKMKHWVIVINDREGLDVAATLEVESLREEYPECEISVLGPVDIRKIALTLNADDLADFCGAKLEETDHQTWRLSFSDILRVAEHLAQFHPAPANGALDPPPQDKIRRNDLEDDIAILLRKGNVITKHIEDFFSKTDQVELESKVALKLNESYREMKVEGLDPNQIFYHLVDLAGGLARPSGERAAVLGILTYFFNKCDIFESIEAAL